MHHLENSRSQRVLWLLEELGVEYEVVRYARHARTMLAPEDLKRIHPLGRSPVIQDGPRVIAETGAIVEYLVDRHAPHWVPAPGSDAQLRQRYWLHYAEGSLMPLLLLKLVVLKLGPLGWPARGFVNGRLRQHLDFLESELGTAPWFSGEELGAADIMLSFPLEAAAKRGGLDASRPRLWALVQRMQARPAYRRAIERGGAYALA